MISVGLCMYERKIMSHDKQRTDLFGEQSRMPYKETKMFDRFKSSNSLPFTKFSIHLRSESNSNCSSELGPKGMLLNHEECYKKVLCPVQHENLNLFFHKEANW